MPIYQTWTCNGCDERHDLGELTGEVPEAISGWVMLENQQDYRVVVYCARCFEEVEATMTAVQAPVPGGPDMTLMVDFKRETH